MLKKCLFLMLPVLLNACAAGRAGTETPEQAKQAVRQVLQEQAASWNRGDLEGYMQGYWQSDSLLFVGRSGLTYGWNQTLQNYRKGYPDRTAMGTLSFHLLELRPLAPDVMLVVGKWHLARSIGDLQGHFSLVFRKTGQKWLIVADHSS